MTAVAGGSQTDPELVAAWRSGDDHAATQLVQRHAAALGRYLGAAGAASADVEDLVQETFFKAFRGLQGWRGDGSFRGWLFRIAGNLLKDRFRQGKGRIFLEIEEHDIPDRADPAGELAADETGRQLEAGLKRLARMQREVFLLRVQQGLDYAEIAVSLGTTPGAARVHYHHAVKRLKEMLE
ncbi:MAG TPA: sigma-70 family RNA polymerase sigma factor [Gemmatimonadales bacterium]|nr:sigma-70 family RNA polymerase sigma factor [Gemmatimonadales bacterium]